MFLISKILPHLVLPLGIAIILLSWTAIRNKKWNNILILLILYIFSTPVTAEALWRILESPYRRMTPANSLKSIPKQRETISIVVLGSGRHPAPGESKISEWGDADRFFGGLNVYKYLKEKKHRVQLIFTGGWWPTSADLPPEGETLRKIALSLGIRRNDILTTVPVMNTAEEAKAIADILPFKSKVILVTSGFHMKRSLKLFKNQGLYSIPFPVDFQSTGNWASNPFSNPLNYIASARGLSSSSRALREFLGRTFYRSW